MRTVLHFFAFLLTTTTFAQENLIPNPSFEKHTTNLSQWSNNRIAFNENINHWFSPTEGSPDIYLNNQSTDWMHNAQGLGLDETSFGKTMIGITTYVPAYSKKVHKREYISVHLKKSIKTGNRYRLEFWIKNPKKAFASSHIGILMTEDSLYIQTEKVINTIPQFEIDSILNAPKWRKIVYEFTATESFNYLTIGSFAPKDSIDHIWRVKRPSQFAYYYIDNISLIELEKTEIPSTVFTIGQNFSLQNIHFEYDKAVLMASSFPELNKLFTYLNENPNYTLDIFGHTDHDGSELYNLQLSQDRAEAVAQFFIKKGILAKRLNFKGFGETQPIAENASKNGKHLNRRVEFIINK
jgi:outer membrane protein OmpA-like peptidoglycan-associated protein